MSFSLLLCRILNTSTHPRAVLVLEPNHREWQDTAQKTEKNGRNTLICPSRAEHEGSREHQVVVQQRRRLTRQFFSKGSKSWKEVGPSDVPVSWSILIMEAYLARSGCSILMGVLIFIDSQNYASRVNPDNDDDDWRSPEAARRAAGYQTPTHRIVPISIVNPNQ